MAGTHQKVPLTILTLTRPLAHGFGADLKLKGSVNTFSVNKSEVL